MCQNVSVNAVTNVSLFLCGMPFDLIAWSGNFTNFKHAVKMARWSLRGYRDSWYFIGRVRLNIVTTALRNTVVMLLVQ